MQGARRQEGKRELTLDSNRYREAKVKAMKAVHHLEQKHQDDMQRHISNVKQARAILEEVDVKFVSPSTSRPCGGLWRR